VIKQADDSSRRLLDRRELGEGVSRVILLEGCERRENFILVLTEEIPFAMAPTQTTSAHFDGDHGPQYAAGCAYTPRRRNISPGCEAVIVEKIVLPRLAGLAGDGLFLDVLFWTDANRRGPNGAAHITVPLATGNAATMMRNGV